MYDRSTGCLLIRASVGGASLLMLFTFFTVPGTRPPVSSRPPPVRRNQRIYRAEAWVNKISEESPPKIVFDYGTNWRV